VALDYDGTLAPIVARPEDAVPADGALAALQALAALGVRVYVISGRPAAVAVGLGGLDAVPGLVVLGHYGLQRWHNGALTTPEPGPEVAVARTALTDYVAARGDGSTVEDKHHSVALHTRRAADPQAALDAARPLTERLAAETGLELVPGRYVLELRPQGTNKHGALVQAMAETGARAVLVAGDDLGDLPALDALDEARRAGIEGMVVCSDSAETPAALRERADLVVNGPAGVVATLAALARAIDGTG
jgi:trehalose 6-phosphate phosphatase